MMHKHTKTHTHVHIHPHTKSKRVYQILIELSSRHRVRRHKEVPVELIFFRVIYDHQLTKSLQKLFTRGTPNLTLYSLVTSHHLSLCQTLFHLDPNSGLRRQMVNTQLSVQFILLRVLETKEKTFYHVIIMAQLFRTPNVITCILQIGSRTLYRNPLLSRK